MSDFSRRGYTGKLPRSRKRWYDGKGTSCPACDGHTSYVTESRKDKGAVFRTRICVECTAFYTTKETNVDETVSKRKKPPCKKN